MPSIRRAAATGLAVLLLSALGAFGAAPAGAASPDAATSAVTSPDVTSPDVTASGATAPGVGGYTDPAFAEDCTFHHFGEGETPPLSMLGTEPLCVEYAKRDITVSNGGAVRFLLAEPARFAIAVPACRYWQLDHWSVQVRPGDPALVGWDGSYWFDKASGTAGASVRNVTVAGQPAEAGEAAAALRPYDPRLAEALEKAAGGVSAQLPASLPCLGTGT